MAGNPQMKIPSTLFSANNLLHLGSLFDYHSFYFFGPTISLLHAPFYRQRSARMQCNKSKSNLLAEK